MFKTYVNCYFSLGSNSKVEIRRSNIELLFAVNKKLIAHNNLA